MSMQNTGSGSASDQVAAAKANATSALNDLKSQAAEVAENARGTLSSMASEARAKVNEMVDQKKVAGADQISGIAHAVSTAAGDLEGSNPQVARLVRDAASSVDRFAGDLRSRDVRDVVDSVSNFARQQPVAFFAGSVIAGLVLARFLKSETHVTPYQSALSSDDRF